MKDKKCKDAVPIMGTELYECLSPKRCGNFRTCAEGRVLICKKSPLYESIIKKDEV